MRRPSFARVALILLAAYAVACGDGGSGGSPATPATVRTEIRSVVDPSRATPANGSYPGAASRTLETRLWYLDPAPHGVPACGRRGCGMILLAHGFGGNTGRFDAIARAIAEAGYVVAAPAFPLTNDHAPGGHLTALADLAAQPADVSFVLTSLLEASRAEGDPLRGRIDAARIGVVGHSLGGATALAATRLSCCSDARIAAVVGVAPAYMVVAPVLGEALHPDGPPTLIVNGSADPVILAPATLAFTESLSPPWLFVEIPGANHVDLIESDGPPPVNLGPTQRAVVAFFDSVLGGDRDGLEDAIAELRDEGNLVVRP